MSQRELRKMFAEYGKQLLNGLLWNFVQKPKASCCGKPVVFAPGSHHYICIRCRTEWELTVSVGKVKRTDWKYMVSQVNSLMKRLQKKPRELRLGYQCSPEGILNAYREGDLSFKQAATALKKWKKSSTS